MSTLSSLDIDFSNLPTQRELSMTSEVGKVLSFFRPVPLADALAKREERKTWISGLVEAHCKRIGLSRLQTASCVDCALAIWDGGRGASPATAVADAKLTANRIAYELDGNGPRAA